MHICQATKHTHTHTLKHIPKTRRTVHALQFGVSFLSQTPSTSFPSLCHDPTVGQSSANGSSSSSSTGLACLIIIIIIIIIIRNIRFASAILYRNMQSKFSNFLCVWNAQVASAEENEECERECVLCVLFKQTHAPNELQSAHNSTKNAVQFLNCEPDPKAGLGLRVGLATCYSASNRTHWTCPMGRVRKISAFWAQKQYVFQTAFPFMLHVVHTFPQMQLPNPPVPSLSSPFSGNAYKRPLDYTICTYLHLCWRIGYWVHIGIALGFGCRSHLPLLAHCLFRFCGRRLQLFS